MLNIVTRITSYTVFDYPLLDRLVIIYEFYDSRIFIYYFNGFKFVTISNHLVILVYCELGK